MSTNKKKIWIVLLSFFALFAILVTLIVILICRENDATGYISGTQQPLAEEMSGNGQIVEANKTDMTIMVYIIGSDLETDDGLATNDINKFFAADLDDNINVVGTLSQIGLHYDMCTLDKDDGDFRTSYIGALSLNSNLLPTDAVHHTVHFSLERDIYKNHESFEIKSI